MLPGMRSHVVLLAPGASGGVASLEPHVVGLGRRGVHARIVALPRGSAERALPVYAKALADASEQVVVIGGHSFGGRVASLLAAATPVAGLVLMSYPLHPPGRSERWDERTAHWPRIDAPVLLLSGTSDSFATPALLEQAVQRLPSHELVRYPGIRHGLAPVLDDALDRLAAFVDRISG